MKMCSGFLFGSLSRSWGWPVRWVLCPFLLQGIWRWNHQRLESCWLMCILVRLQFTHIIYIYIIIFSSLPLLGGSNTDHEFLTKVPFKRNTHFLQPELAMADLLLTCSVTGGPLLHWRFCHFHTFIPVVSFPIQTHFFVGWCCLAPNTPQHSINKC